MHLLNLMPNPLVVFARDWMKMARIQMHCAALPIKPRLVIFVHHKILPRAMLFSVGGIIAPVRHMHVIQAMNPRVVPVLQLLPMQKVIVCARYIQQTWRIKRAKP